MYKDPKDAFDFLDEIAEKSQIWSTPNTFEPNSQKGKSSINPSSSGIYHLKEEDCLKAQLATMAREVETLKSKLPQKVNSIASQEIFEICEVCWVMGHVRKDCTLRKRQLNELEEVRNDAYENSRIYKERTKIIHEKNILRKNFEPSELVLLYNSRLHLFPRKLRTKWTGLFIVKRVFPCGTVEVEDPKNGNIFKVNGQ
ncbi:hypothetical protein L3X38_040671 [Prunus dulcis]|uniref:Uncharacterized protein n=1 Tax=Prunus dulcis TaxID=3755 RepID=A0AAD4YUB9_PRUDU|nr:hypothetical protein L3X38_040671 [Prunus dulcis]